MKTLCTVALCLATLQLFAQTKELVVEVTVPHGSYASTEQPSCMPTADGKDLNSILKTVSTAMAASNGSYVGALLSVLDEHKQEIKDGLQIQGAVNDWWGKVYGDKSGFCLPLVGVIPAGSTNLNILYEAEEIPPSGTGDNHCSLNGVTQEFPCNIQYSKFIMFPKYDTAGKNMIISTIFMNWSHNLARTARMRIKYTPPP